MEDGRLGWLSLISTRAESKLRTHTPVYYLRIPSYIACALALFVRSSRCIRRRAAWIAFLDHDGELLILHGRAGGRRIDLDVQIGPQKQILLRMRLRSRCSVPLLRYCLPMNHRSVGLDADLQVVVGNVGKRSRDRQPAAGFANIQPALEYLGLGLQPVFLIFTVRGIGAFK